MNAPFTIDDDDVEMPLVAEGWTVNSEDRAAWAVERLLSHEEAIARLDRQYERNRTRLEREQTRAQAFFVPQLEAWAQANPPRKGKTIHLATGDIGYRTNKGGIFVDDEAKCLEWAETLYPECIRREVVRKLDVERAKRKAVRLMSEAIMSTPCTVPLSSPAEARAEADRIVKAGEAALPPGVVRRDDRETFFIKGGSK